jgi:hypothetical protein
MHINPHVHISIQIQNFPYNTHTYIYIPWCTLPVSRLMHWNTEKCPLPWQDHPPKLEKRLTYKIESLSTIIIWICPVSVTCSAAYLHFAIATSIGSPWSSGKSRLVDFKVYGSESPKIARTSSNLLTFDNEMSRYYHRDYS